MKTALKEWAVIVEAIKQGKHHFLLRKGGLADKGQTFKVEHSKFLFFPTYEHQEAGMIQSEYHSLYERFINEPSAQSELAIDSYGEVKDIYKVNELEHLRPLSEYCIWSDSYFQMRVNYKPDKPLYIILLDTYLLKKAQKIQNLRKYGGCRSWVEIEGDIELSPSTRLSTVSLPESVTKNLQKV